MATIEGGSLGNENHPVVLEVVRNLIAIKSDVKLFLSAKANKPFRRDDEQNDAEQLTWPAPKYSI